MLYSVSRKPKTASGEQVYNHLEQIREQRGLSRQNLADGVDVHYQTIGYLERGEYSPSLALALRIARFLDLPTEALFSLDPPITNEPMKPAAPISKRRSE
jgi:putative transcriptional regulator